MSTTRIQRHIRAPRAIVYRALLDARAIARWRVPAGMTSRVHAFEAREGGTFRVSLTYDAPTSTGKTSAHTDTYRGRFVTLVPDAQIVEAIEFETTNPAMQGTMTITTTLADADGGTELVGVHENLPPGVRPADNELGWRIALDRLAALVEGGWRPTFARARHVSIAIARAPTDVYAFACEPANLPQWAAGLAGGIAEVDGAWIADSPMGKVTVRFVPRNAHGVLDHEVVLPSGTVVYNPLRVVPNDAGSEVVFTLFRRPDASDDDFAADADAVARDLAALKALLER